MALIGLWLLACGGGPPDLVAAFERAPPPVLRGRGQLSLESGGARVQGEGAIVLVRPGQARIDVRDPAGRTRAAMAVGGGTVAVWVAEREEHRVAAHAEEVVREISDGALGLDGLIGLSVADLPDRPVGLGGVSALPDGWRTTSILPTGDRVQLDVDAALRPMRLELYDRESLWLVAAWGDFDDHDPALPRRLSVALPDLDVRFTARLEGWEALDAAPRLELPVPDGVVARPIEGLIRRKARVLEP